MKIRRVQYGIAVLATLIAVGQAVTVADSASASTHPTEVQDLQTLYQFSINNPGDQTVYATSAGGNHLNWDNQWGYHIGDPNHLAIAPRSSATLFLGLNTIPYDAGVGLDPSTHVSLNIDDSEGAQVATARMKANVVNIDTPHDGRQEGSSTTLDMLNRDGSVVQHDQSAQILTDQWIPNEDHFFDPANALPVPSAGAIKLDLGPGSGMTTVSDPFIGSDKRVLLHINPGTMVDQTATTNRVPAGWSVALFQVNPDGSTDITYRTNTPTGRALSQVQLPVVFVPGKQPTATATLQRATATDWITDAAATTQS